MNSIERIRQEYGARLPLLPWRFWGRFWNYPSKIVGFRLRLRVKNFRLFEPEVSS